MCSDFRIVLAILLVVLSSCSSYKKIHKVTEGELGLEISMHDETESEDTSSSAIHGSIRCDVSDGPMIMNAVRDSESGEMVAVDVISASKVVARFRNVAERNGVVTISFDIHIPSVLADSRWQLKLYPYLYDGDDVTELESLYVTGSGYRERQLKGYERYHRFMSSILTDSTDLIQTGQLEIFLQRNFPETFSMKSDSSSVPDFWAEGVFGATQEEASGHYVRRIRRYLNERRKAQTEDRFMRYVPDPIVTEGVMLDTVLTSVHGDFIYRYTHSFDCRAGLKKVRLAMTGDIYEDGTIICSFPFTDDLTFYISSLASMADTTSIAEQDTLYMEGLRALKELDYRTAVTILGPYQDYNAALAFVASDMDYPALKILRNLDDTDARICYLKALVFSRMGEDEEAVRYFELSVANDSRMEFRANLDPEMSRILDYR